MAAKSLQYFRHVITNLSQDLHLPTAQTG